MGLFPTPSETLQIYGLDKPDSELLPNQRAIKGFMQDWYAITAGPNLIISEAIEVDGGLQADPVGFVEIGQLNWGFRPESGDTLHLSYIQAINKRKGVGSRILTSLNEHADKHGVTIDLSIQPMGSVKDGDPMKAGLRRFYRMHGYNPKNSGNWDSLVRPPGGKVQPKPWPGSPSVVATAYDVYDVLGEDEEEPEATQWTYYGGWPDAEEVQEYLPESWGGKAISVEGDPVHEDDEIIVLQTQPDIWVELDKRFWRIDKQNPMRKRRNPSPKRYSGNAELQLGKVTELEIYFPDTGESRVYGARSKLCDVPLGRFHLSWKGRGKGGSLKFVKDVRRSNRNPSASDVRAHREFHGTDPSGLVEGDDGRPYGKLEPLGYLKAITYNTSNVTGSKKGTANYHHIFGDTGHAGKEHGPSKMPLLLTDGTHLVIRRRNGNTYYVGLWNDGEAWIIG